MTERQRAECLRLLSEAQALIKGHNRAYNKLSRVRSILVRDMRRKSKKQAKE